MADPVTITAGFNNGTSSDDDLGTSVYEWDEENLQDRTTLYSSGARGFGGDDTLVNNGEFTNVLLDGGAGNDSISNGGVLYYVSNTTIDGGAGNDRIENYGDNAVISAGDGNNTVDSYGNHATITSGNGNDNIYSDGNLATISSGNGNDTISHVGDNSTIDAGAGDDSVYGYGNNLTIRGGAGNDELSGDGYNDSVDSKILLDDTDGDNYFRISYSNNSTINAGSGSDTISADNTNEKLLINAGAGDNSIVSQYGNGVTIQAQGGNDTITIHDGKNFSIDAGDGANVIETSNINDTTSAGFTINSGAGADSITNRANNALITAGDGNNTVVNGAYGSGGGSNVTINTGSGNDFINNYYDYEHAETSKQENVIITSGAGNDTVTNSTDKVTIDGGAGNDELSSYAGSNVSINGGAGSDTIFIANGTVSGGAGDDSLSVGDKVLIQYSAGDGNDVVWSFDENSTLSIGGGNYSSVISGSDVVLTVGNGKVTLSDAATLSSLNIVGTLDGSDTTPADNVINNSSNNTSVTGTDSADIITTGGDNVSINAGAGADSISLTTGAQNALIEYTSGDGNDLIQGFNATSTLSITGANYSSVASGNDVVLTVGDGKISLTGAATLDTLNIIGTPDSVDTIPADTTPAETIPADMAVNIDNFASNTSVTGTAYNDSINNFGAQVTIQGLAGNDFLENNEGDNVTISGGAGNDTLQSDGNNISMSGGAGNDILNNGTNWVKGGNNITMSGGAGNDSISNNWGEKVSISGGAGNDYMETNAAFVTMNGGAGSDRISLSVAARNTLIEYKSGDGNDIIYGFDGDDTLSITGAEYSSVTNGNDVVLTVGNGKITLSEAATLDNLNIVGDTTAGDTNSGDTTLADTIKAAVVANMILHRTEAGYPVIAGMAFHPEEYHGDEPTNYVSKETWEITSNDGLKLEGIHYTPENSNDKWVVIIHGYGHNHKHMYPFAGFYLANGYNVLMVDQRAAGESEGEWLTMGAAESQDIALWTQEIARRNSDAKITLFGVSMGSATAMLAAARSDIKNVTSLVEDCGYTNMMDVVRLLHSNIPAMQSLLSAQDLPVLDTVASVFTGYNLSDAAPLDSISAAKMPSLFITGTEDAVVPVSALTALYDASGADVKEKFIVDGATHGVAGLYDPVGYSNTVFRFLAEANEEGWATENIYDNISLRGTSYNDTITNSGTHVIIQALGGDDYLVNDVDSSVTTASLGNFFDAGNGNDTIYSYHSYNPTLIGGDGNDSIVVSRGHMTYIDAGNGDDSIIGSLTGGSGDWHMGGHATIYAGNGNDYLDIGYSNDSSIFGGNGNDTIITNGIGATIDAGAGNNLIRVTDVEKGETGQILVLDGNTTIENFGLGFGDGSDTIYIKGAPAGVDFRTDGLTFYRDNDSFTLSDVSTTAKVQIYHERRTMLNKGVFIGNNEWYSVESSDLSVKSGEEVYFVGTSATGHGVDFSGITENLNVTLDTEYEIPNNSIWINGVYSIRGGAGNMTITGSALSDTIIAGTGNTTIDARGGDDYISLTSARALVEYASGDGNDLIDGFNANSTLDISGAKYSSVKNGDDLILTVGDDKITLTGAANLSNAHIVGTYNTTPAGKVIDNSVDNTSITGTAYNDTINNAGENVTIDAAAGDDKISLGSAKALVKYNSGDGNDLITGFNENSTLNISGAKYFSVTNKNDLILFVGDGRLTLKGASNLENINIIGSYDEAADSIISNSDNNTLVSGTSSNDTIVNTGSRATIEGLAGNDSIISSGANGLIFGGDGNDIVTINGSNVLIFGDAGNDSIFSSGTNATINGGDGSNYVSLSGANSSFVVLEGKATVDGFTTGFGSGSDSILITGDPGVDFKTGGLTFYEEDNGNSLTLHNVTDTAKVYLYYSATNRTHKGIFIAKDDMYTVTDSDFSRNSNEDIYFVGTSATNNHGIDFSNISRSINVTLNTDYGATPEFWVNNVHSIIGGAGRTQITGSDENDTIIAGTGATTINAGDGNDNISLTSAQARIDYEAGDGNDLIQGFNANSTLNISGTAYTSVVSGNNVILTVGDGKLTLQGAADLETLNIVGTTERENDYNGGDKTISDYSGQAINFNDIFVASAFNNGNFLVQSTTGLLTIENVADKIIDLRDGDGNVFVKAYTPSQAGVIDGRGISGIEIIEGSSAGTDVVFAGDGGSSLWGGAGTDADALVGGAGADIFVGGRSQGNDNIFAASSTDVVNLIDASLSDIVGTIGNDTGIAIGFNTGNVINIQSTDTLSAAINLSDGSSWRYNHSTKSWQNA